ncbi:MAG: response regulator [Lachnospiraceae bacterium]|nr:response regulator [Lachnospiraceae bacterium]
MDQYKVMLVDDEEDAREAIERCINWEEIGYRVVAGADNGEDALIKAEQYSPDVVLTDIQMPFMDGLTFCRRLKEIMPDVRIIIFSGYDEFEYAQEAIRLEAEEYILKPINAEELTKVFLKIKERLDDDYDRRHNTEQLKKFYEESLPVLKEQFLIGLLEGHFGDEQIKTYSQDYGFSFDNAFYSVGMLVQEKDQTNDHPLNGGLLSVSLMNLVKERLAAYPTYTCINYLGTVVVIGGLKNTGEHRQFIACMDLLCKTSKKLYGLDTVAGVGKIYGNAHDISRSFDEAREAVEYRMLIDGDQAIYIGDVEPKTGEMLTLDEKLMKRLVTEIKVGDDKGLNEAVEDVCTHLKKSTASIPQLRLYCTELIIELARLAAMYQLEGRWESTGDLLVKAESFTSFDEITGWLKDLCVRLKDVIREDRQDATRALGEKAEAYIRDHYMDSKLSVDMLCSHLGIGTTYFSTVFKKETGLNFVAYLTKVRMEEAVRLLKETDEKSYVIAGMVGYDEPTYFSYVFKKAYGVSPAKYRNNKE